jgi:hypothetical protein
MSANRRGSNPDNVMTRPVAEAVLRRYPDLRDYRVWATYLCGRLPAGLSNLAYGALERTQEVLQ